ncbi:hypothetical protein O1M54_30545 [Streptomyces diastatochromogenes]|nr:hypothetical protein [Streptomyces diastatochromogenes]
MRRPLITVTTAAFLLVSVASTGGTATAAEVRGPASVPAAQCTYRDAFPPGGGTNTGGIPNRYQYANSPYAGARFDSCADSLQIYYGGFSNPRYAYYEIAYTYPSQLGWYRWVDRGMGRRIWSVRPPITRGDWNFKVRACANTIDSPGPGTCTAWSPQLFLHAV